MSTYILLSTISAKGKKTLGTKPKRILEVNKEIEAHGAKVIEKRPLGMDSIELFGLLPGQMQALLGDDAKTRLFEAGIDLPCQVAPGGVGLDDR